MNNMNLKSSLIGAALAILLLSTAVYFTFGTTAKAAPTQDNPQEIAAQVPTGGCSGYREYVAGKKDNYVLPTEPTSQSPALTGFIGANAKRQFDEGGLNKAFGQSFRLCTCRIAKAEIEIGVRAEALGPNSTTSTSDSGNDSLTIGEAPFSLGWKRVYSDYIWTTSSSGGKTSPKVMNTSLSAAALNNWMLNTSTRLFDVYIQDDTAVDYVKLKVWYF